jgi:Transposase DDE domain group 1
LRVQATNWASSFEVTTDGTGVVGHAGAALLRELADRLGLTKSLGWQQTGARRRHPDAAVLRDLAVLLADGGDCLSDLAVLRDQPELFGPVASTPTAWRVLDRVARDADGWPGCGPPGPMPAAAPGPPAATRTWSCWSSTPTRLW